MTIGSVESSAYMIPTDAPEADGTFAWDSTTLVLVEVSVDCVQVDVTRCGGITELRPPTESPDRRAFARRRRGWLRG
jgi:hypothetical protein